MESTANACAALGCMERRRFLHAAAALPPVAPPPAGVDRNASGASLGLGRMYDRSIARRPSVRVLYTSRPQPIQPLKSLGGSGDVSSTRGGVVGAMESSKRLNTYTHNRTRASSRHPTALSPRRRWAFVCSASSGWCTFAGGGCCRRLG